ncbi:radical SAM superfamily protein [Tanacetum coccineum]
MGFGSWDSKAFGCMEVEWRSPDSYIHLPFCRKRCHYCDFPVLALGSSSPDDDPRVVNYINLLIREIEATKTRFENNPPLETVFFGGGTPSLVPPRLVAKLMDTLRAKYGVTLDAEISMEMDLGTLCGRAHGVEEVCDAIEIVGKCGFNHIQHSINLMVVADLVHELKNIGLTKMDVAQIYTVFAMFTGSASYINGTRYSRPKKLKDYTNHVQDLEAGLVDWGQDDDEVDEPEMAMDIVYEPYMKSGHVLFLDDQRREITEDAFGSLVLDDEKLETKIGFIRLSDPDGFLLSNELISLAFGVIDP